MNFPHAREGREEEQRVSRSRSRTPSHLEKLKFPRSTFHYVDDQTHSHHHNNKTKNTNKRDVVGRRLIFFTKNTHDSREEKRDEFQVERTRQENLVWRSSDDANWRAQALRYFQGQKHSSRLKLEEHIRDESADEARRVLVLLNKTKGQPFEIEKARKGFSLRNEWTDPVQTSLQTKILGIGTSSLVKTSKQANVINGWATIHLESLKTQIVKQRTSEVRAMEKLELCLMEHEEERQKLARQAIHAEQDCGDFISYMQLQTRFGALPDWQLFRFGRLPGRRYERLLLRSAKRIQKQWRLYWPERRRKLVWASEIVQRVYRGHIGRLMYLHRMELMRKVEKYLFRIKHRLLYQTFSSWEVYTTRSVRMKQMLRRTLRGTMAKVFQHFADITKQIREARLAKLRVFSARLFFRRALRIIEAWSEYAQKCRSVKLFVARILIGRKYRIFQKWCGFVDMSKMMRTVVAHQTLERAVNEVSKRVGLERYKIEVSTRFQAVVRGRLARKLRFQLWQDRELKQRQIHRRVIRRREKVHWSKTLKRLEKQREIKIGSMLDELRVELQNEGLFENGVNGSLFQILVKCEAERWYFANIETADEKRKRERSVVGKIKAFFQKKKQALIQQRALEAGRDSLRKRLIETDSLLKQGFEFRFEYLFLEEHFPERPGPKMLRNPVLNLLQIYQEYDFGKLINACKNIQRWRDKPNERTNDCLVDFLVWFEDVPEEFFSVNALKHAVKNVNMHWFIAACMVNAIGFMEKKLRSLLPEAEYLKLEYQHVTKQASLIATLRLAAMKIQSHARRFLGARLAKQRYEQRGMSLQESCGEVLRELYQFELLELTKKMTTKIAVQFCTKTANQAKKLVVIYRKRQIRIKGATRIQTFWRRISAKDILLRKVVESNEKIWHAGYGAYYYFSLKYGTHSTQPPVLLKYCGSDDIPTPRSKERDILRPIYTAKEHQAAMKIQKMVRIKQAKNVMAYMRSLYYHYNHEYYY